MAATRTRRNRQPAQPAVTTFIHEMAAAGLNPTLMELTVPSSVAAGSSGLWREAIAVGLVSAALMGSAAWGASQLLDPHPAADLARALVTGGPTGFATLIAWAVSQNKRDAAVYHVEFPGAGQDEPAMPTGEPMRNPPRFVAPDPAAPQHIVTMPGDWTPEKLQAFARRLIERDYDLTVRSWLDFCSYEQLTTLLAWLETNDLVHVVDGRGKKGVRARGRGVIQRWAAGHIDAL